MNPQFLIILCGEAFSGKSTLAKKLAEKYVAKIVGRDEIYFAVEKLLALENTPDEDDDALWSNLWSVAVQGVKNQLLSGNTVVFDDNCLQFERRQELKSVAEEIVVKSILVYLDTPTELLKKRKEENKINNTRHDVPSAWMVEDSVKFERPTDGENPIVYREDMSMEELSRKIEENLL